MSDQLNRFFTGPAARRAMLYLSVTAAWRIAPQ